MSKFWIGLVVFFALLVATPVAAQQEEPTVMSVINNPLYSLTTAFDLNEMDCTHKECHERISTTPSGLTARTKSVDLGTVPHPARPGEMLTAWYTEVEYLETDVLPMYARYVLFSWSGEATLINEEAGLKTQTAYHDLFVLDMSVAGKLSLIDQSMPEVEIYQYLGGDPNEDSSWAFTGMLPIPAAQMVPQYVLVEGAPDGALMIIDFTQDTPVITVPKLFLDSKGVVLVELPWAAGDALVGTAYGWSLFFVDGYTVPNMDSPESMTLSDGTTAWGRVLVYRADGFPLRDFYIPVSGFEVTPDV